MLRPVAIRRPLAPRLLTDSQILAMPSLVGWFDMQRADSYTVSGGTVASITNRKTGVAWNTVVTAAPFYEATGFNGRPCMLGGGAQGLMSTEATVVNAFVGSNVSNTVLYVVDVTSPGSLATIFGVADSGAAGTNNFVFGTTNAGGGAWLYFQSEAGAASQTATVSYLTGTGRQVMVWRRAGGSTTGYCGRGTNQIQEPLALGSTTPNRCAFFARPGQTPDVFFSGRIAEVMVFGSALGPDVIAALERYEIAKWGLGT